jgi:hypothetical protein
MGRSVGTARSWVEPTIRAIAMLVATWIVFLFVPNRLLGYLSVHLVPTARDLAMVISWAIAFVFASWLFVRLQRGERR